MGHAIIGKRSIVCCRNGPAPRIIVRDRKGNEYRCEWGRERFEMAQNNRSVPIQTGNGEEKRYMREYLTFVRECTESYCPQYFQEDEDDSERDSGEDSDSEGPSEVRARTASISGGPREEVLSEESSSADVLEAAFNADR